MLIVSVIGRPNDFNARRVPAMLRRHLCSRQGGANMISSVRISVAFLDDFANAWNRHDIDAILSMMTANCVFESSRGPDVAGTRYVGQAEVRRGIEEALAAFPD